jgi:lycopene cyclase domain-containing protein
MFTYFLTGLPFVCFVILLDLAVLRTRVLLSRQCWLVLAIMFALTAIFNQLLTGLPIVNYNEAKISGVKLGHMPIEDFMYSFAAVVGLGSLRKRYEQR